MKTCKDMCEDLEANHATSDQARDAQNGLVEDHGFDKWIVVASPWMTSCGGLRRDTKAGRGTASGGAEHAETALLAGC